MAGDPVLLLPTNAQGCCLLPVVCADSFGGGSRASRRARGRIPQVAAKQQLKNPINCLELLSEGAESSRGRPLEAARALLYRSGWILHVPPSPGIRSPRWPGKLAAFAKGKQKRRGFSLNGAFLFLVSLVTPGSSVAPGGRFSTHFAITGSARMDQDLQALFELKGYQHTNDPPKAGPASAFPPS